MRKVYTASSTEAWADTAKHFHTTMRDERFTTAHGEKAGYKLRKGEESGLTQEEFHKSYTFSKLRTWHHKRPLEWSGETRRLVRMATITSTSSGGKAKYPGAAKLNFRNPHSDIRMGEEFRKLIPDEMDNLAQHYDKELDRGMNADQDATTKQV